VIQPYVTSIEPAKQGSVPKRKNASLSAKSRFHESLKRDKGWAKNRVRVPMRVISDTGITDRDKTLYMHYSRYPQGCWKSDAQLAKDVGCKERGIRQSRLGLEKSGYIECQHRGRQRTCFVTVTEYPNEAFALMPLAYLELKLPYAMRTLLAAMSFAQGDKTAMWHSSAELARMAGINAKHANRLKREMLQRDLISSDHDSMAALGIAAAKGGRLADAFTLTKSGMSRRNPNTRESKSASQPGLKMVTNRSIGNDKSIHSDVTNRSVSGDNSIRLNRSAINHPAKQLFEQELRIEVPLQTNSAAPLGGNGSKSENKATESTKALGGGPVLDAFSLTGERAYFAYSLGLDARDEFRAFIRDPKAQRPSDEAWQEWCDLAVKSRRNKWWPRRHTDSREPTDDPVELALRRSGEERLKIQKEVEAELRLRVEKRKRAALAQSETETSAPVHTLTDAPKVITTPASSGAP